VFEQSFRLEEAGAGIQLPPNATSILLALGLGDRLRRDAVAPESIAVKGADDRTLARVPLGTEAERRYGAPYWSIHRGDLQAALVEAVEAEPAITLRLGARIADFATEADGLAVHCESHAEERHRGLALVAADGLWSALRARLGHRAKPQFRQRTAWRALVPAAAVEPAFRRREVTLQLGRDAHLVHYPVKAGDWINIVAIVGDRWDEPGWSAEGRRDELLARFAAGSWAQPVRRFLAVPEHWQKWALYDVPPLSGYGDGPVTLLGDAAHPMLPFLAQGAAMAIEDAAVLAAAMARMPDRPAAAMRRYEAARRERTARVQRAARGNGHAYHLGGAEAALRDLALRLAGGHRLLRRYDWLYGWRLEA